MSDQYTSSDDYLRAAEKFTKELSVEKNIHDIGGIGQKLVADQGIAMRGVVYNGLAAIVRAIQDHHFQ